jgi:peroxiredoxin
VDGKEALLMLARDLTAADRRPLLKDLIVVFAPIFNADGNEKMSKTNRPGQVGPEEGMGVRANRYSMLVDNGVVKTLNVEAPGKFEVSKAEVILSDLS